MDITGSDRDAIARAREVSAVTDVCAHAGKDDLTAALIAVLGEAQFLLADLAGIIDRLAAAEDGSEG